jgi:hypothetical protein
MSFPNHVAHKYENIVVDFVIGGDISLRATGDTRFKELLQFSDEWLLAIVDVHDP